MKTYAMMVLGCKVNDYEAAYVRENMNKYFSETDFKSKADIYLIFTCCVTNTAEAKTRKFIHAARRNNPDAYIAAIGCLSQIKSDSEVFEDVDLIIGSDSKDKIVDLIYLKYLKAKITYEHDRRVETYPYARNAIREAIYNAIAHNCYMYGTPIQIRIEEEQIIISNRCILPEGWTAETLMQPHDSIPYNPDIANVFYRAGYIETWGQGIQKICDECVALGAELPKYEIIGTGLRVYFPALKSALIDQPKVPKGHSAKTDGALDDTMALRIIEIIRSKPDITLDQLSAEAGIARRTLVRYMSGLKDAGRIERIGGKRYGHWQINE